MVDNDQALRTGDALFEAFVEQVKQVLEHLYDFAYLQQHPLARVYDSESDLSAKTAGRQLRYELIKIIESLKPPPDAHFRAPDARLYNVLHLYYVENLSIQEAAAELGLSERQAYRDLKRAQENVAAVLWDKRLPPQDLPNQQFSLESEVARVKLNFNPVNIRAVFQQACNAVERLARQQSIDLAVERFAEPLVLSTDPALAHQIFVSVLSSAIQEARPGKLSSAFASESGAVTLTLRYALADPMGQTTVTESAVSKLAQRLQWRIAYDTATEAGRQVVLRMVSRNATVLVIDDNDGWIELLQRFLEGYDCAVVTVPPDQEVLRRAQALNPNVIILDVMMPERDGWELLQRLRAQPATSAVPIIVCTVFNDPQLAYSLGAAGFVAKPASRERILEALKQAGIVLI